MRDDVSEVANWRAARNLNKAANWSGVRSEVQRSNRRSPARLWVAVGTAIAAVGFAWLAYSYREGDAATQSGPAPLRQVVVSKSLVRELDSRLGFLGQFSAVDQVELRAQVGGTLTGIHFKDGDIVHQGDLLFTIDPRPYEIRLAQATAQLESASARLELAKPELWRARELKRTDFGTMQAVDQRTADLQAARASIDDAKAQIRDAQFDLEPLPHHRPLHRTHRHPSRLSRKPNCRQPLRDQSDDIARDTRLARSDLLRLRHERVRFPDVFPRPCTAERDSRR